MPKINDGGPAFPRPIGSFEDGWRVHYNDAHMGMSLRDFFAAHALQSLIAKLPLHDRDAMFGVPVDDPNQIAEIQEAVAESALGYADAMMRVRDAQQSDPPQTNSVAGTRHG